MHPRPLLLRSGHSLGLYSPNDAEVEFSEVGMQDAACPARWPPYGQPETSRFLKVDHYMLRVRIKMRSGAYASSRQDTDYAGAGGWSGVHGAAQYQRSGCPDIDARTSPFKSLSHLLGPLGRRRLVRQLQRH
jgi:hypothetical protein